jgi:hypothetical protein
VTEIYQVEGISMKAAAHVLERKKLMLRALGAFCGEVRGGCNRWADDLGHLGDALDREYPGWRDMPEAK